MIVSVLLSTKSWYGHPEMKKAELRYNVARNAAIRRGGPGVGEEWDSGLICWFLIDETAGRVARVYEPTETCPWWVWCDGSGNVVIEPPITMERLQALMVEYRLRGGLDVDALRIQA